MMNVKTFAKSTVVFRQGDKADSMYEILTGSIGIFANYGEPTEKLLTTLTVGNTFGEMGMIESLPRSATAVALSEDTNLQVITSDSFASYFNAKPERVLVIMKHMSKRIRGLTQDYVDACRAIAEYEEHVDSGKKSGWLKDHFKKFMEDYAEASSYMHSNPELYHDVHNFTGPYFF
ncbi:MAG: cyclic nucleotide-binding domain-containing protein [Eubacteriales bacterium]|nr:cyclic nucleotide-binding domain-containing protein [Eubacteriales bacterium]